MFAVVTEQARVKFGVGGRTHRARALGGEHLTAAYSECACACSHRFAQPVHGAHHLHHAFAVRQCRGQGLAQRSFLRGVDVQAGHREFNMVFFKAVNAGEALGRDKRPVDAQMGVTAWAGPIGELGVDAFASDDQGRKQPNMLAFEVHQ